MKIEIGDQADCVFFQGVVAKKNRHFDVIVDDRGHKMHQQKTSFNTLCSQLADGGLYIMEDTQSSYWPGFSGGFQEKIVLSSIRRTWSTGCTVGIWIKMMFFSPT